MPPDLKIFKMYLHAKNELSTYVKAFKRYSIADRLTDTDTCDSTHYSTTIVNVQRQWNWAR